MLAGHIWMCRTHVQSTHWNGGTHKCVGYSPYVSLYYPMCCWPDLGSVLLLVYTEVWPVAAGDINCIFHHAVEHLSNRQRCRTFSSFLIYRQCVSHLTLRCASPFGECAALCISSTQTKNYLTGAFDDIPKFGLLVDFLKFFVGSFKGLV